MSRAKLRSGELLRTHSIPETSAITVKPMLTMPAPLRTGRQQTESSSELNEQIRCRAYEWYEQRGREDGRDLDDWLHAEAEITQMNVKATTA